MGVHDTVSVRYAPCSTAANVTGKAAGACEKASGVEHQLEVPSRAAEVLGFRLLCT